MNDYVKVKDNNALLSDSKYEYEKYMRLKKQKEDEVNRVDKMENEIDSIKNDVSEIKNLLKSFIDKLQ